VAVAAVDAFLAAATLRTVTKKSQPPIGVYICWSDREINILKVRISSLMQNKILPKAMSI
jgi:hypothetical protein